MFIRSVIILPQKKQRFKGPAQKVDIEIIYL